MKVLDRGKDEFCKIEGRPSACPGWSHGLHCCIPMWGEIASELGDAASEKGRMLLSWDTIAKKLKSHIPPYLGSQVISVFPCLKQIRVIVVSDVISAEDRAGIHFL